MVQGIAARRKRYVEVEATFLEDGRIVPRAVIWHDGRRFPVRAVLGVRRCTSLKVGGEGVRYDVLVGHAHTFLFHEEPAGSWRRSCTSRSTRFSTAGHAPGVRTEGSPVQRATSAAGEAKSGLLR